MVEASRPKPYLGMATVGEESLTHLNCGELNIFFGLSAGIMPSQEG